MKVRARARREQGEAIIPMINVIFLLLIFLMLAGRPGVVDPFELDPAEAARTEEKRDAGHVLFISADFDLAYAKARGRDAVLAAIARAFSEGQRRPLQIKADAAVDTIRLLEFLRSLEAQGVRKVLLLTQVPRDA
ncbi:MAG: hypothetical protein Kow0032_10850 [Methyloligellaceae bacterium]